MKRLRVFYWNPNGTNDAEIVDCQTLEVVETLQEAFFGIKIEGEFQFINPKYASKHVAVSPVSDGSETVDLLMRHFKKVGAQ